MHYVLERGGVVSFPTYLLGPKLVGGTNLFEFRPHSPPADPGGGTVSWPAIDWFGDIYSGYFDTRTLPDGPYELRLLVYKPDGSLADPTSDFTFIVPTGTLPDGTITTARAPASAIVAGGFVFTIHVDNSRCGASIEAPIVGCTTVADRCGFLLYDPAVAANDAAARVRVAFHATHPGKFATFSFSIVRGANTAFSASGEVAASAAGDFTGDGNGNFANAFTRTQLLGPDCPEKAAFSLNLYVYAKATNGWVRLQQYDASAVRAFAMAPQP
ncbi:MAG: hypothetical protein AB7Y46_17675 [Armatimonadota bacterium]